MNINVKQLRIVLLAVLFTCSFIYFDTYLALRKQYTETIKDTEVIHKPRRRGGIAATTTYLVHTEAGAYVVLWNSFELLKACMNLTVDKSQLTGAVQKLSFQKDGKQHHFPIGPLSTEIEKWLLPFVLFATLLLLILLTNIRNTKATANLTLALVVFSLLTLLSYLGVIGF